MEDTLGQIVPRKLKGDQPLHEAGKSVGPSVLDYWRWSASNLLDNTARGILAEFIVASALGVAGGLRTEWDAYDLKTESGTKGRGQNCRLSPIVGSGRALHDSIRYRTSPRMGQFDRSDIGDSAPPSRRLRILSPRARITTHCRSAGSVPVAFPCHPHEDSGRTPPPPENPGPGRAAQALPDRGELLGTCRCS